MTGSVCIIARSKLVFRPWVSVGGGWGDVVQLAKHIGEECCLLSQLQRRLELDVSGPHDLQDGGRTTKAIKPMASLSHTEEKAPAQMPVPSFHSQLEKARFETSLSFLTRRFAELVNRSPDGILDLNIVAHELNAPKRRVYDVTNVLEGIQLIKKKSKNYIEWLGGKVHIDKGPELDVLIEEEKKLDELIQTCVRQIHWMCEDHHSQRFAYLTYEDVQRIPSLSEQTVIVIKAPAETKLEVPHPEESLQVHLSSTQGPIEVFICSDEPVPMEAADPSVTSDGHLTPSTNGKESVPLSPSSSFIQLSVKDDANKTSGNDSIYTSLCEPTQQSSSVMVTPSSPMPTSPQPPSEDQQNFVTLPPPLAASLEGEDYVLNLAENEHGITDFYPVDLDQLPLDAPLL